jgi:hypothetical protein
MPIKMKTGDNCVSPCDEDRNVTVNIPSDANTALSVEMDDVVTITIKGKVKGVHATKGDDVWGTPGDIRVEVDSIEVDGKNAFADLVED